MLDLKLYSVTVIINGDNDYYFDKWSYTKERCELDVLDMFRVSGSDITKIQIEISEADPDDR